MDVETNGHTVILEDFSKWFNPKWVFGLILKLKHFTNINGTYDILKQKVFERDLSCDGIFT